MMKKYHFEETVAEGKSALDVINEIGSVAVEGHHGRSILIDAEVQHMEIDVTREGNTVFVHTYKEKAWSDLSKTISRWFGGDHPKAHLTIKIPIDCELRAKTVTGSLTVNGVDAPVTTRVITGKNRLENLNGPIYAKTITGDLQYDGALKDDHHRFETITGKVLLKLRQEPNARFDAGTTTGHIHCAFPLAQQKENRYLTGGRLRGVLGNGAGYIKARVVTGSLHVEHG